MKRAEWQAERWTKDPLPCWWIWWAGICPLPLWEDWCWGRGSHGVGRKSGGKRGCDEGPWAVGCSSCLLFEPILQILAWVNIWRGYLYQEAFPDLSMSLLQRPYHSLSGFPKHTFFSEVLLKLVFDIQRFHQQIFNEHQVCPSVPQWLAQWIKNLPALQKTQEIQVQSLGQEDSPQRRKMATRSSILAWKIPWTEEPERLTVQRGPKGSKESNMTEQLSTHHCAPGCVLRAGDAVVRKTGRNPCFPVACIHVCVCEREKQQMNNLQVIKWKLWET